MVSGRARLHRTDTDRAFLAPEGSCVKHREIIHNTDFSIDASVAGGPTSRRGHSRTVCTGNRWGYQPAPSPSLADSAVPGVRLWAGGAIDFANDEDAASGLGSNIASRLALPPLLLATPRREFFCELRSS